MSSITIGTVAKAADIGVETVRFYNTCPKCGETGRTVLAALDGRGHSATPKTGL